MLPCCQGGLAKMAGTGDRRTPKPRCVLQRASLTTARVNNCVYLRIHTRVRKWGLRQACRKPHFRAGGLSDSPTPGLPLYPSRCGHTPPAPTPSLSSFACRQRCPAPLPLSSLRSSLSFLLTLLPSFLSDRSCPRSRAGACTCGATPRAARSGSSRSNPHGAAGWGGGMGLVGSVKSHLQYKCP